jgi:hypothetical protein
VTSSGQSWLSGLLVLGTGAGADLIDGTGEPSLMRITGILFRPPLAIARLGGADTPMDSYVWRADPTVHGAARTVIEPAVSFEVLPDGSVSPFVPSVIRFRDRGRLRPVAPFLELWARIQRGAGSEAEVPLTGELLTQVGARRSDVVYGVRVANRKAARRTGDESNGFAAGVQVRGDDVTPRPLLASSPPTPGGTPLVWPEHPVPLGSFQVIRPVPGQVGPVDLDILRVRFTPARGEVYGPPSAIVARDDSTGREYEIVPPGNRILNPAASWVSYAGTDTDPQPADTYDGADQGSNQSWGVVDDTCDGIITADLVVNGRRFSAQARICVGPPDFAPDRRPFVSLADDLADRDLDPAGAEELLAAEADTQRRLADLFQRVWETASLVNVDAIRARALGDNRGFPPPPTDSLPHTDATSMRPSDTPYADATVEALIPETPTDSVQLVFSTLVALAHDQLAEEDELVDFLFNQAERLRLMIRPAYGAFHQLSATVAAGQEPNPAFRDPRIFRDQMHDMRMPPYMRDETATALGLTRRQYEELMVYVAAVAVELEKVTSADTDGTASPALLARSSTVGVQTPLGRRVQRRLRMAAAAGSDGSPQ